MASYVSAAFLWGLDVGRDPPAHLDLTVPESCFAKMKDATVHRTRDLPDKPVLRHKIPVTPLARTLMDLAELLEEEPLALALGSALRKHSGTFNALEKAIKKHGNGRHKVAVLSKLLEQRRGKEPETGLETLVRRALLAADVPPFEEQYRIRNDFGVIVVRGDFVWPSLDIVLYGDSREWHSEPRSFENDRLQWAELSALGWHPMHVTRKMLRTDTWLERLKRKIAQRQRAVAH